MYEENQKLFETDEEVGIKVMEVDKNNDIAMKELSEFLKNTVRKND